MTRVFDRIYKDNGSDPTASFPEIFASILMKPENWSTLDLKVIADLLEWTKISVAPELGEFEGAQAPAIEGAIKDPEHAEARRHRAERSRSASGSPVPTQFQYPSVVRDGSPTKQC